jgi:hypothetical protein
MHQVLTGQTVLIQPHRSGLPYRTGTIELIAANEAGGEPQAHIRLNDLKPPATKTDCAKCGKTGSTALTTCGECNTYYHNKCAKVPEETPKKWHCAKCKKFTRVPIYSTMTIREAHAAQKHLTRKMQKQRTRERSKNEETLKRIATNYPPGEELVELASPPKKLRVVKRRTIFDGPWQQDTDHQEPPQIDTWKTETTEPTKTNATGEGNTTTSFTWQEAKSITTSTHGEPRTKPSQNFVPEPRHGERT